ncbi:PREDICTED: NEDD8 ultimate buster 1-like [Nicrophorus vespilloides]|uniref:NEDD8 ultimate buster 1-like n=1 Tax=Nicrophorus vespilloides TaxID=110193 RepID=A0ABM1NJD9_NICVS|nr:PREDICTED: NEDD8 ultimate buster 1-like [Nicrophorus vespilloides]
MMGSLKIEDVFIQVRDKLQRDGIKLWLSPYFNDPIGPSQEDIESLAKDYCKSLNMDFDACHAAISELQTNAIEKLKQRDRFKESGVATIKIKILNQNPPKLISKEILLSTVGMNFKVLISDEVNIPIDRLKLIANGIVIKETEMLSQQGIKNGSLVLAIVLKESLTEIHENEARVKDIEKTKEDTSLLASDVSYMQLEDQHGNAIQIPDSEKKALMIAMALHEKGRSALKKEDYARALVFLLDADKEFSRCNSALLNSVDNYALLDLDIAWCFLCLQSFVHLPEAYSRLKRCEDMFHRSYGPNLERLIAVKGSTGNEAALFTRLHLLQAIVLYHQNDREAALKMFEKCREELSELKVDENKMLALVELGYTVPEARLGLRSTHGDVNLAANYINDNRNKRIDSRKKALTEKLLKKERKQLGKCVDGKQYVNPLFVRMLINMGYSKQAAKVALQKTNNIISDSIQYIQEHPQAGPSNTRSEEFFLWLEELAPELTSAGFELTMAIKALQKHNGDLISAAEELLNNNGIVDETDLDLPDIPSSIKKPRTEDEDERLKKEAAWNRLSQDISMVDDDHLDLTLEREEDFLNQYLSLLSK